MEAQAEFASSEDFPYALISDPDHTIGRMYDVERSADHDYHAMPMRITYLIDPDGEIAAAYDVQGTVYEEHADEVLADIVARS